MRLLSHAIQQPPETRKTEPCRNNPPFEVAWILLEHYEQADDRAVHEIMALFDRAVEMENGLESQYGRVEPRPLAVALEKSTPRFQP